MPRPAAGIALCLLALAGCGTDEAVPTTLPALAERPDRWDGREVVVRGIVRSYPEPRHYWIETTDADRVALAGDADLEPLVGWTVDVRGTFRYDRTAGRRILVRRIDATE